MLSAPQHFHISAHSVAILVLIREYAAAKREH